MSDAPASRPNEATCVICVGLMGVHTFGEILPEDVSDVYADGFADGVAAVLRRARRRLCARHEIEVDVDGALAELGLARAPAPTGSEPKDPT